MGLEGLLALDLGDVCRLFLFLLLGGVDSLFMKFVMGFWLILFRGGFGLDGFGVGRVVVGCLLVDGCLSDTVT